MAGARDDRSAMEILTEDLRRMLAAKDPRAFDRLHQACAESVLRFVAASVPRQEQAEDLSQEVWLAVREALPRFEFASSPRTWVLGIAAHKIGDFRRRASRRVEASEDLVLESLVNQLASPRSGESMIDAGRHADRLRDVLAGIDAADRELLWDRYVIGLSPAEIVEERGLDVAANTLSQRLVRLTRKLREALPAGAR